MLTATVQIASDVWPESGLDDGKESDGANNSDGAEDSDLEAQVAKELASIKRPRKEQRFGWWA